MSEKQSNRFPLLVIKVFNHAEVIDSAHEEQHIRKDANGKPIKLGDFGDEDSPLGWVFDLVPSDNRQAVEFASSQLRPLHINDFLERFDDGLNEHGLFAESGLADQESCPEAECSAPEEVACHSMDAWCEERVAVLDCDFDGISEIAFAQPSGKDYDRVNYLSARCEIPASDFQARKCVDSA